MATTEAPTPKRGKPGRTARLSRTTGRAVPRRLWWWQLPVVWWTHRLHVNPDGSRVYVPNNVYVGRNTDVNPGAYLGHDIVLEDDTVVGALVVIEDGTVIGSRSVVHDGVYIGSGCRIGYQSIIEEDSVIGRDVHTGVRLKMRAGSTIGYGNKKIGSNVTFAPLVHLLAGSAPIPSGTTVTPENVHLYNR